MATKRTPLIQDITEEILSLTAGESDYMKPSYYGESVNKGRRENESYEDTPKEPEPEATVSQRQFIELQIHIRRNEDEIRELHGNVRELRQVVRELIFFFFF
jgi:hypothetical protein